MPDQENLSPPMAVWVVYDHPRDFPEHFVARLFEVSDAGGRAMASFMQARELATIQQHMTEMGLIRFPRDPEDNPAIVEVWL